MRILKKFFLAAGMVGLIGSVGFAREAQAAAGVQVNVDFDKTTGTADITWENTDTDNEYDAITGARLIIEDKTVKTFSWPDGLMPNDPWSPSEEDIIGDINSKAAILTKSSIGPSDLKFEVDAVVENEDETYGPATKVDATVVVDPAEDFKLYRVEGKVSPEGAGTLLVKDMDYTTFYSMNGKTYTFMQTPNSGYTFDSWTASPVEGTKKSSGYDVKVDGFAETVTAAYTSGSSDKPVTSVTITSNTSVSKAKGESFNASVSYEPSDANVTKIQWGYRKSGDNTAKFTPFSETGASVSISTSGLEAGSYEVKAFVTAAGAAAKSSENSIELTVTSSPSPTPGQKIESVSIKAGKVASSLKTDPVELASGETLYFEATYSPDNTVKASKIEWFLGKNNLIGDNKNGNKVHNYSLTEDTQFTLQAKVYNEGSKDPVESNPITVTLKKSSTPSYEATTIKVNEDQLEYITQGYTLEVKGTITGTNRDKSTVKFEKFKGEGAKIKDVEIEKGTDKSTFRFKIDTEDCSVSSGETLEVKVKVTVAKGKSETEDLVKEEFFVAKVYPKSTLSYASDTRKFSYTAPTSVNTGTESGKGDNDKDNQLTNFTGCKGVLIKVWKGDVSGDPLWTSTSAVTGGNSASINAESLVTALTNDKKLSESGDFKFRVYPCNSSNKYNKNVYSEYSIHIYKINVAGTGVTAQSYYGLSGQEIEIKAVPIDPAMTWTADSYWMDDATKKEGQTRKVKVTEDKTYTAVLGTKTTSDNSASGKAGVNKWGQSNVGVYFAVVLVIGAVCLGLHLYDRKKKNL